MCIEFSRNFRKAFLKLPKNVQGRFEERMTLFIEDPSHSLLKTHPLKGLLAGYFAFRVTGDYRVIFRFLDKKSVKLLDIGKHGKVY